MGLKEDLQQDVAQIFKAAWSVRDAEQVPEPESLKLGNDAAKLEGTVLYADMSDSTKLVDGHKPWFAAEVYKAYLTCAARVIRDNGGSITAYDGDRVMAVFIGDLKNTSAVIAALKINYAVLHIINRAITNARPEATFRLSHVVGIDVSSLFAARIGIRSYNDIVWVGRAANYAAKLSALNEPNMVFIADAVFQRLRDDAKYGGTPRQLMWEPRLWTAMNNMSLHRSSWWWQI